MRRLPDAPVATQAVQHDPNLLFSRVLLPCPPNVLHDLFGRRHLGSGFLSHLRSPYCYDEPETLRYSSLQNCPMSSEPGNMDAHGDTGQIMRGGAGGPPGVFTAAY